MQKKIVLQAVHDSYISSFEPEKNYFSELHCLVGKHGLEEYQSLFCFDSKIIPPDFIIEKAVLSLFCVRNDNMSGEKTCNAYFVQELTDIKNVNWLSEINYDENNFASTLIRDEYWQFISWDITACITPFLRTRNDTFGFLIKSHPENSCPFMLSFLSSNQDYAAWRPKIEIFLKDKETSEALEEISIESKIKDKKKTLAILTPEFFEASGEKCIFGGKQRYLVDLINLLKKIGYEVKVFQPSLEKWERTYAGITVYGMGYPRCEEDFYPEANLEFARLTRGFDSHIYFNLNVAYPEVLPDSICIWHGIWWDSAERVWWRTASWHEKLASIFEKIRLLIAVDVNSLNWFKASYPNAPCEIIYLPNYVDFGIFRPSSGRVKPRLGYGRPIFSAAKPKINILYPRRLHPSRGWTVCKEVALELVQKHKNLTFSFVGRGNKEAEEHMRIFSARHPRIQYSTCEFQDMYKVYRQADIVLLPSLSGEGVPLTLLEAMASGKAVIAGMTGGIPSVIIDGFNGLLINVTSENLMSAIENLLENPRDRKRLGANARQVAREFAKENWEQRWLRLLKKFFL